MIPGSISRNLSISSFVVNLPILNLREDHGGGQERGKRSGTENVPGIAGFGKAAELVYKTFKDERKRITNLKELLKEGIFKSVEGG